MSSMYAHRHGRWRIAVLTVICAAALTTTGLAGVAKAGPWTVIARALSAVVTQDAPVVVVGKVAPGCER